MERNVERAEAAYELIKLFPGISQYTLRQMLGIANGAIHSTLMMCDTIGLLVYEDDEGGLYAYEEERDDVLV